MKPAEVPALPDEVATELTDSGITSLYPPQESAVEAGVTRGESVVAAVPTASGKTLIAELAMLSSVGRGGKALYIVPLRALASEKHDTFSRWEACGVTTGISTGNYDSDGEWLSTRDIIVATSEKVDSLIRNNASWIGELECVIIDEVHLADDDQRGPTLEVTLAKLRQINQSLQTVALSATVSNAGEIANWLDATLIESSWRPIELKMGVHYGQAITFQDQSQRKIPSENNERPTTALVRDGLRGDDADDQGSSLVFVNSRRNAETAAERFSEVTDRVLTERERDELAAVAETIRDVSDTETSEALASCVETGAAFHHAGLASKHRSAVESAFRKRLIKCIAATPTLAAGVNTPSRRVIVRDWRRYDGDYGGMKPLDVLEVHQMMGRAGRPGLDPYGEAVVLAKNNDQRSELRDRYIEADPETVDSKLANEPALRTHILSTIATGFAHSRDELSAFLEETLYFSQTEQTPYLKKVTDDVLRYLERNGFIERTSETLQATSLGHTVSRIYIDPMSAAEIIDGLRSAENTSMRGSVSPHSEFTPASKLANSNESETDDTVSFSALGLYQLVSRTPDMYHLYLKSGDKQRFSEICYDREAELLGRTPSEYAEVEFENWLAAVKTGCMLEDWACEVDEDRLTERYGVGPGDIRGKVETAQWLLEATEQLADEVGTDQLTIREAKMRVTYGVREELLPLANIPQIGRKRARLLFNAGIESRADLRVTAKSVILRALRGRRKTAETILENVGREDPSMDGVDDADEMSPISDETNTTSESTTDTRDQANLGDFN